MIGARRRGLALVLVWLGAGFVPTLLPALPARAEEPWEAEVRRGEEEEDRLLEEAKRRGTTGRLVNRYASRVSRQPTALNHYLLGRALYYNGDAEGAERQLRQALALQPRFWFAQLRLAMLELERKRPAQAEHHLTEVLRVRPREPDAMRLLAQLRIQSKDWDRALQALEDLLSLEPTNEGVRRDIALVLMQKEDWGRALKELRILRGRSPRDPMVRWHYAVALYRTQDLKEAAREFEGLVRINGRDLHSLDMLRRIYIRLEDAKGLEKTLERMVPLVDDPEKSARIQEILDRLRAGEGPGRVPSPDPAAWPADPQMDLLERCIHPTDGEIRRKALQAYYEAGFSHMPFALAGRLHPRYEPDPICRQWLLRIMGQMENPFLAQVAVVALYDPDAGVSATAAETLGDIGTPSGVIYLIPILLGVRLDTPPTEDQVKLMNAARTAMVKLTGRSDRFGGLDAWVAPESVADARTDWGEWLASPEGVHARLGGIADLVQHGDTNPHMHLVEDVSDPDLRIARAAYLALLRRSKLPSDEDVAATMWPRFPVFEESDLTPEGLGRVRGAVNRWWNEWRALRERGLGEKKDG